MICESYMRLPSEVENLTLNQILLMSCDKNRLLAKPLLKMSPSDAASRGLIPPISGKSLVQRIREEQAQAKQRKQSLGKRERRRKRREALRRYVDNLPNGQED